MKKIIILVFFILLALPCFAIPEEDLNSVFNYFYTYNKDTKGYKFNELTKSEYNEIPTEYRPVYKNLVKANNYYEKGNKASANSIKRIKYYEKAVSLNDSLYPAILELGLYYGNKGDFDTAEYYFSKLSKEFLPCRDLTLARTYLANKKSSKAIEYAKEYLKQQDISKDDTILANYIIMRAYYNFYVYDESLKYANILIYTYNYCHKYQLEAWTTRYNCYYKKADYKNALNVAIQMAKMWGYKEYFEYIKACAKDKKTRISSYNIVKKDHQRRGNTEIVSYIDTLISQEKDYIQVNNTKKQTKNKPEVVYVTVPTYDDIDDMIIIQQMSRPVPSTSPSKAEIIYGYNPYGEYVPKSVGEQSIHYGYDPYGNYVPKSVGGEKIHYGYDPFGNYVPKSIGGKRSLYEFDF